MSTPSTTETQYRFAILGTLRVTRAGVDIALGGQQQRAVLARLLVAGSAGASLDQLADTLWGEHRPDGSVSTIQTYIFHLRKLLEPDRRRGAQPRFLPFEHGRYRLVVAPETIDAVEFERATDGLEQLLATGAAEAAGVLQHALALWRGEVLADLAGFDFVTAVAARLEERRLMTEEALIDCELALGSAGLAVTQSEELARQYPLREKLQQRRMLSLYRAGRQSEALACYETLRRRLRNELGIDPSAPLQSLHQQILTHDPSLDWHSAADRQGAVRTGVLGRAGGTDVAAPAHRRIVRRRTFAVVGGAIVLAGATALSLAAGNRATKDSGKRPAATANSVVALNADGSLAASVAVGARPVAMTSSAGTLWVANFDDRSVTRVDVSAHEALRHVSVGGAPAALVATRRAVWVTDDSGHISKIDPRYDQVASTRPLSTTPTAYNRATAPLLVAYGFVWVVDPDGYVSRVDIDSARHRTGTVDVGNSPSAIAAGAGSVWVTNAADGTVTRIDPQTLVPTTIPVGHQPVSVVVNSDGVWIATSDDASIVRIDPATNTEDLRKPVGEGPAALLATRTALWVANSRDGTVMRLDPHSGAQLQKMFLGGMPDALAFAGGRVWVAIAPAPPPVPAAGGVARLTMSGTIDSLDPALPNPLGITYATCANLVTYPDKPAPDGSRIVPEIAEAIPTPTDHETTYKFVISPGFRFSPPSNEVVTASTVKSTIEREADRRMRSPFAQSFSDIVGYRDYVTRKASGLAGVVARGNMLTIRLTRPDGAFLAELAGGATCVVPRDTPAVRGGLTDIPSAGPYYIASYTPRAQLVLKRNPNYHGDRPCHFAQIIVTLGIDPLRALRDIESGKSDYALDGLAIGTASSLQTRYGPGSKAAKAGRQQYFVSPADGVRLLHMNMSRSLFAHVRLRRAVNYAIDRAAIVAQSLRFPGSNPFSAGQATDTYTPASTIGASDPGRYPLDGPDLSRAKKIAGRIHATAIMYTPTIAPWPQEAQIIRQDLKPLGIDIEVKQFPFDEYFSRISHRGEPFDLAVSGWAFSSTDPAEALATFDGSTIRADGNGDFSYFDNPAFNRQLAVAARLSGAARYRAYGHLELELERDFVPAAALADNVSRDFFSARIGCQVYQPIFGMDIAALCLRS